MCIRDSDCRYDHHSESHDGKGRWTICKHNCACHKAKDEEACRIETVDVYKRQDLFRAYKPYIFFVLIDVFRKYELDLSSLITANSRNNGNGRNGDNNVKFTADRIPEWSNFPDVNKHYDSLLSIEYIQHVTHVVPTDDSDDSDSEDGFMEVECRHVKDVHIIEYLEYPQKKSLVLPNNITIYFKGNSLEARDGNFIYKYKPVSYTHLDVYKRQRNISLYSLGSYFFGFFHFDFFVGSDFFGIL